MDNRSAEALIFWVFTTIGALLLTWLISRGRTAAGMKLTLLGIIVALVALWYGLSHGIAEQSRPIHANGQPGPGRYRSEIGRRAGSGRRGHHALGPRDGHRLHLSSGATPQCPAERIAVPWSPARSSRTS